MEFEFVQFFGLHLTPPGQKRDDWLTLGSFNIDGLIGLRPLLVFSNHLSLEPSLGLGFPSILGLLTSEQVVDIPGILFLDVLYHFHFPGLYPYLMAGLGYWWHYLSAPPAASATGVTPGSQFLLRPTLNVGIGLSFLAGFKVGMTFSLEGGFGSTQNLHFLIDIDYAFL